MTNIKRIRISDNEFIEALLYRQETKCYSAARGIGAWDTGVFCW